MKSRLITLKPPGTRIEVAEGGKGRDLLFLHGAGGHMVNDPLLAALATKFHVVAPLLPGYGRSEGEDGLRDMLDVGLIDASWHLPPTGRKGDAEFGRGHIPGAVFFNIDVIADTSSGLPHMLPDAALFATAMSELGLGDGMHFVGKAVSPRRDSD